MTTFAKFWSLSKLLSQTSANVMSSLELQLYTSNKVLELTKDIGTMSASATEAAKVSTQVAQILQLISTFHGTTNAVQALSDNVGVLTLRSEGLYSHIFNPIEGTDPMARGRGAKNSRLAFICSLFSEASRCTCETVARYWAVAA